MDPQRLALFLVAFALLAGVARTLWFARRTRDARPRGWRIALLLLLQLGSAALLYRVLVPPSGVAGVDTLVVATTRAPPDLAQRLGPGERLVALPEAPRLHGAERVPDLGTALRRHPGTARVHVVGGGLTARDRDQLAGRRLVFTPAPRRAGLVELDAPARVVAGADFVVRGAAHGLRGGAAELLDPSGRRVDREPLDAQGRVALLGAARTPGTVVFRLRLHDARGRLVEDARVPLAVVSPPRSNLLVLAGAPDAELKFLRRWALDSGARLHTQIQLGGGMRLGDAPIAFTAAALEKFDAVVIDERAWEALGDARRRALAAAVHDGLGLLLRVTGPVSPGARRSLGTLGLQFAPGAAPATFALRSLEGSSNFAAARSGPIAAGAADATSGTGEPLPRLARQPLRIGEGATAWLRDTDGRAVAGWWPAGHGRSAAWLPTDTYRLVLLGREDVHAALWSEAIAAVARPRAARPPGPPADGRTGERVVICGLTAEAIVLSPGGTRTRLPIDPRTGPERCAGFWPATAGWHRLGDGDASVPFYVRAPDELPGVAARDLHEATARLSLDRATAHARPQAMPGPRWPWFLAWLLASALLWWLERSRLGRVAST